ncbi:Transcription factor GTE4 [Heracleum sosnowskyi]|uniref:Transcription factor GTE4 n=1 Tax=Heracleum sosnowskyi TaxID=360622 RepID=A0AAD8NDN5_9APIA|nr:Transcription factor GTE4 [Heracleum sosnowskyi]
MASETIGGANDLREKQRWGHISKVYTRKFHNKRLKNTPNDAVLTEDVAGKVDNGNVRINGDGGEGKDGGENCGTEVVVVEENLETRGVENGNSKELGIEKELGVENGNSKELGIEKELGVENGNSKDLGQPENDLGVGNGNLEDLRPEKEKEKELGVENGNSMELQAENELGVENGDLVEVQPENGDSMELQPENGNSMELQQEKELGVENGVLDVDNRVLEVVEVEDEDEEGERERKEVVTRVDDKVRINLGARNSKDEFRELRSKLVSELDQVRSLVKELEEKEIELSNACDVPVPDPVVEPAPLAEPTLAVAGGYGQSQHLGDDVFERRALTRVQSEVGPVSHMPFRPAPVSVPVMESHDFGDRRVLLRRNSDAGGMMGGHDRRALMRVNSEMGGGQDYRPFRQLSASVMDNNNHVYGNGEFVEKEKRTPKANQFYRNSEFLLGKDRLPPESNKKPKSSGGRKHGGSGFGFGMERHRNQAFKNCGNLLQRLMKHKHGWVFNEPVNARLLGLHDYHDIIKHPMDLGTIKNKLAQNLYKSPAEYAEDVRLAFSNAMTYNPPGQDVHVMAAQLSEIFEEKWAAIESEYNHEWRNEMMHYAGLQTTPTSRAAPPLSMRALDRSQSMLTPGDSRPRPSIPPVTRTPVPKKPKAKDPNKRDMTYEEKQKLSTNLQSLPSEKLDSIVQIIKKRNSTLNQHDDEIEVDIDSVDVETLWELDRLVTNYKKSLSKNRRKAEIARERAEAARRNAALNPAPPIMAPPRDSERAAGEMNIATGVSVPVEKQHDNASRSSSSSSSSSSDSGSSSSDSDSDSSSADGSDAGHSPRS